MAANIQMKFFPPITRCFKRHENTRKCRRSISIEFFARVSQKSLQRKYFCAIAVSIPLQPLQIIFFWWRFSLIILNSVKHSPNKYDLLLDLPSPLIYFRCRACRWVGWWVGVSKQGRGQLACWQVACRLGGSV